MNDIYRFIIYLESVKAEMDNSDHFIQTINSRYIYFRSCAYTADGFLAY